jgi:hypothetical protein
VRQLARTGVQNVDNLTLRLALGYDGDLESLKKDFSVRWRRLNFFGSDGAPAWAWAYRWEFSADIGAFVVNGAEAGFGVEEVAIPAVFLGEHEELSALAVAADDAFFDEALGEFFYGA